MVNVNVDIKPREITSAYLVAPFDQGKEAVEKADYRIISLEENARLRIQEGKDHDVSRNGNWVREDAVYVPNKGKFLTKNSPIMAKAKEATQAHRDRKDFYLTSEQVEQALVGSILLDVERLPKLDDGTPYVPTNRFKDNPITVYAFGKEAENYGAFLREAGINKMPIELTELQEKPFARKVWFRGLDGGSVLGCYYGGLDVDYWVRGVRDSAEGTAKNFEAYTPAQITEVLKAKGLTGIESLLLDALRQ